MTSLPIPQAHLSIAFPRKTIPPTAVGLGMATLKNSYTNSQWRHLKVQIIRSTFLPARKICLHQIVNSINAYLISNRNM